MLMSHEELTSYMQTNFALMKFHKYTLEDLENMLPWEREVYIGLLIKHLEDEKAHQEKENAKHRS